MTIGKFITALVGLSILISCGDEYDRDSTGACVSDPVHLQFSSHVYCYDGWDRSDCTANDSEQVNGADWTFKWGKDCSELDLEFGSNPYDGSPSSGSSGGGTSGDNSSDTCQPSESECVQACESAGFNAFTGECTNGGDTCECTSQHCGGCADGCLEAGYSGFSGVCDPGVTCYCSNVCGRCDEACRQGGYQGFSGTCTTEACLCD